MSELERVCPFCYGDFEGDGDTCGDPECERASYAEYAADQERDEPEEGS